MSQHYNLNKNDTIYRLVNKIASINHSELYSPIIHKIMELHKHDRYFTNVKELYRDFEIYISNKIVALPADAASESDKIKLFGNDYCPGTFILSERKYEPKFLFDEPIQMGS